MSKLKEYHFDVGDSNSGPLGLCARVRAKSKAEALHILANDLPTEVQVSPSNDAITYINVYINPTAISTKDIDDGEEA